MLRKSIVAAASTLFLASSTQAALLTHVEGTVMVNKGEGFWKVARSTMVSAGDRVLVRGKGGAQIDYGDGCIMRVSSNQTIMVKAERVCDSSPAAPKKVAALKEFASTKGPVSMKDYYTTSTKDYTVSAKDYTVSMKDYSSSIPDGEFSDDHVLVVGGLLVAGGAAVALALNSSDHVVRHEQPASP